MNSNHKSEAGVGGAVKKIRGWGLALALCLFGSAAHAEYPIAQQSTLMDRIQIEDLIYTYMWSLDTGNPDEFAANFTEDGTFDLNNQPRVGRKAIAGWITGAGQAGPAPVMRGKLHILFNNPLIRVDGNTATIKGIWTGTISDTVKTTPRFVEQGHYNNTAVKKDGRWYFSKVLITADGGMPDLYDKTFVPR